MQRELEWHALREGRQPKDGPGYWIARRDASFLRYQKGLRRLFLPCNDENSGDYNHYHADSNQSKVA